MFKKYSSSKMKLNELAKEIRKNSKGFYKSGIKDYVNRFKDDGAALEGRLRECEEIHKRFLVKWPADELRNILTLDNYVIGKGDKDNFCYWVERETRSLGSILGATSDKFKVYFDKKSGNYKWVKRYKSAIEAFEDTKNGIIELIIAGKSGDFIAIKENKVFKSSHMFRGKILFLYFPNMFLNVFAEDDIDFFLERLGIEFSKSEHILDKQKLLLDYKNSMAEMIEWSNLKFGYFLYSQFNPPSRNKHKTFIPKKRKKIDEAIIAGEEGVYLLPRVEHAKASVINVNELTRKTSGKGAGRRRKYKANYIIESIRNMKLGDQGEEIVLKYEKELLIQHNRNNLSAKVERVSLEDDSLGYDIKSFTVDGKEKYIDVKATKSGVDGRTPFYMTENEKQTMENNKDKYNIYRVFSANTQSPKILIIDSYLLKKYFSIRGKLWEISI